MGPDPRASAVQGSGGGGEALRSWPRPRRADERVSGSGIPPGIERGPPHPCGRENLVSVVADVDSQRDRLIAKRVGPGRNDPDGCAWRVDGTGGVRAGGEEREGDDHRETETVGAPGTNGFGRAGHGRVWAVHAEQGKSARTVPSPQPTPTPSFLTVFASRSTFVTARPSSSSANPATIPASSHSWRPCSTCAATRFSALSLGP